MQHEALAEGNIKRKCEYAIFLVTGKEVFSVNALNMPVEQRYPSKLAATTSTQRDQVRDQTEQEAHP